MPHFPPPAHPRQGPSGTPAPPVRWPVLQQPKRSAHLLLPIWRHLFSHAPPSPTQGNVPSPFFQTERLKLREAKQVTQGHTAGYWGSIDWKSDSVGFLGLR